MFGESRARTDNILPQLNRDQPVVCSPSLLNSRACMCERDCESCSLREDIKNLVPICDAAIAKGVVQDIESRKCR